MRMVASTSRLRCSRASPSPPYRTSLRVPCRIEAGLIMYIASQFAESRLPALQELIRAHPFATLVSVSAGCGLAADHLPLLLDASRGPHGVLLGHVARANPVWRELDDGAEVLAIFQGPHHYISPSWYASKREHGKVVPTWNYVVVHVRGRIRWVHEPTWLRSFLERLTNAREESRTPAWQISDAPAEYVDRMLGAIVGLEIHVSAMQGKWKLSQNRSAEDQAGVVAGLTAESSDVGTDMAARMRECGDDDH